jgi:outer membrane receptor for ferrienterochelin and colicins
MNTYRRVLLGVAVICGCLPGVVGAQTTAGEPVSELSLEQLLSVEVGTVFGASRYGQRVIDAPAAVSIITHEEITRFGYRTLGDVLRGVRGFYVTNDRNYSYLGVRGFSRPGDYNTRVLFLLDGHRLNETVFDSAYIGEDFPVPIDAVERIEVIRGPGSSVYGTNAFFAVINIVTKTAAAIGGLEGSIEGGSLGRRGASAMFGKKTRGGMPLVFAGSAAASDGQASIAVPGMGVSRHMDDEQAWKGYGSTARGNWRASGTFSVRKKRIPTGAFGIDLNDHRSRTRDARGFLDLSYDGAWRGTGVFFRTAYDRYAYNGTYAYLPSVDGDSNELGADSSHADWWTSELMLTRRVAKRHFLTAGIEYRNNFRQDQDAETLEPAYDRYLVENRSSQVVAAFAQDEIALTSRFSVTAGLRHDRNGSLGSTNLRLAAIFKPAERSALKLLHGSAFRAPNPYESFYYVNPEPLLPERIRTTEGVWEQYVGKGLRTSVSVFQYHARDLISQRETDISNDGFAFVNVDEATAVGVEVEGEATWRELHMLVSFTTQDVRGGADDERLSNSPRNMLRSRITGPLFGRVLFYGVEGLYTGDRNTLGGAVAEGAFLGNVTITSRELSRARLSLTIGNLFDQSYGDPGAEEHPGDIVGQVGRTFRAQLTWRF